ncbi:YeeE/YedE thiosulfate transporter family protein [Dendrosporobacter sp. 1207_IL3150]|uniref:YeeE/YedE thiosulfate transporter family protein n=1 Tax=Dendrosporobacter sp. 1207_IL3150 TaxID=3084054 RepID=UPI002FDAA373
MMELYGLITGILFGFLLQKGRVLRYDKQIAALRLQDMTIVKFMLSHICVAMVGVYILYDFGLVKLSLKPMILGSVMLGGILFGLGWGMLGYCPGTSLGALGEGRWDSIWGILGMLVGAGIFAEVYPYLQKTVLTWGNLGKITIPQVFGINHWIIILIFIVFTILLFRWLEKKDL